MQFICAACGEVLSNCVECLKDQRLLSLKDGEDRIPKGFTVEEHIAGDHAQAKWCIHLSDASGMRHTHLSERRMGCCGMDGFAGPNLVCTGCGVHVATEHSDCWMPHRIVFEPQMTLAVESDVFTQ